jgi:hypothetical protein
LVNSLEVEITTSDNVCELEETASVVSIVVELLIVELETAELEQLTKNKNAVKYSFLLFILSTSIISIISH